MTFGKRKSILGNFNKPNFVFDGDCCSIDQRPRATNGEFSKYGIASHIYSY